MFVVSWYVLIMLVYFMFCHNVWIFPSVILDDLDRQKELKVIEQTLVPHLDSLL